MNFRTSTRLSTAEVKTGLNYITKEGLAAEAMSTFTSGAFLVALALHLGATNMQIGVLAALPTFTNVFQLLSIWLVQRYRNRRLISVICTICARIPLLIIGLLPFVFTAGTSLYTLFFLLFFQHLFGSVSGASWHAWMKDLVPGKIFGAYFSSRARIIQILNVSLSLAIAIGLDHIKVHYPQHEVLAYAVMFIIGGSIGMVGVYLLSKAPEPATTLTQDVPVYKLISRPLANRNFKKLLTFHAAWVFAVNIAMPFYSVYLMKTLELPMRYVIAFGILAQASSICSLKMWGKFTDKYSNKTVINVCAPAFIACTLLWSFTNATHHLNLLLLVVIHVVSGASAAGINLAINNVAVKLAPSSEAIVYISARNIVIALTGAFAPLAGGFLADVLAAQQFSWSINWPFSRSAGNMLILQLEHWNFLFIISSVLAFIALRFLRALHEEGETNRSEVYQHLHVKGAALIQLPINTFQLLVRASVAVAPMHRIRKITSPIVKRFNQYR